MTPLPTRCGVGVAREEVGDSILGGGAPMQETRDAEDRPANLRGSVLCQTARKAVKRQGDKRQAPRKDLSRLIGRGEDRGRRGRKSGRSWAGLRHRRPGKASNGRIKRFEKVASGQRKVGGDGPWPSMLCPGSTETLAA